MQRPESSLSDHSVTSSAGASSLGLRRPGVPRGGRPVPGGPRRPSAKASLPSSSNPTQQQHPQQQQEQRQEQHEERRKRQERRQSQPPSYVQSQYDVQTQRPMQSYTPPPMSAVASDSSCSHPPMSVFTRADTPSSMSALSPVHTTSPAPIPEPPEERLPSSRTYHSLPLPPSSMPESEAQARPARTLGPSVPSISKPSTPAPESPASSSGAPLCTKPRICMFTTLPMPMPVPLQPPPSIDFFPVPVTFKALTLDAAQWTFSSAELQAIVSRAIRASAEPSSIRLLPLQTLDEDLVQEVERLESERAQATAQYRFTMHRRTMLLQSLNASSTSPSSSSFSTNTINLSQTPTLSPAADLARRLAEVSATLDRLAATLVRVSDQIAQIRSLQDVHAASALAVALRKLNASYARRTREVQSLKEKLAATEEERDEAWRVAEELAMEFDGEGCDEEFDDVVVNGARAVAVPATLTRASRVGMRVKVPGVGPRIRQPPPEADLGGNAENEGDAGAETADSPSTAPDEATPVVRRTNSATSRVTAARTRSIRASKASLRFPRKASSRPPSTYSQHSTQSQSGPSRARSRSRANSISSLRDASPTSTSVHGASIPDVPKIPNASELARLASVKSTASSVAGSTKETAKPPLPPMPPPPIETSSTAIASFLDMTTRPNSVTDEKGKSPEKEKAGLAGESRANADARSSTQQGQSFKPTEDAQANGDTVAPDGDGRIDDDEQWEQVDGTSPKDEEAQVIIVHPRLIGHQTPLSASLAESSSSSSLHPEMGTAKKEIPTRPSLHVYPPKWTRPPPDSPVDVTRGSGPHRADNGDDDDVWEDEDEDEEERELKDAFESAYVRTQQSQTPSGGRMVYLRSPLRVQHTQSMLPLPGTSGPFVNNAGAGADQGRPSSSMRRSPASDDQIPRPAAGAGPFRGAAANANARRPTSLPSAQGEKSKPWDYF